MFQVLQLIKLKTLHSNCKDNFIDAQTAVY